ncbi:MAG: FISUMP domain-containing protein [Salinivirgaceae bacterium]|nr:FISUMP domain-containing protein [Salinivirgaceae bacterium]MDD4747250.1 FISUMP domain-containing protein [Salinivirgaceae bacterium]
MKKQFIFMLLLTIAGYAYGQMNTTKGLSIRSMVDGVEVTNISTQNVDFYKNATTLKFTSNLLSNQEYSINAYPNPAMDMFHVNFYNAVSGNVSISVVNISGQIVAKNEVNADMGFFTASVKGLPSGIYVVSIMNSLANQHTKVLVQSGTNGTATIAIENNGNLVNDEKSDNPTVYFEVGEAYSVVAKLGDQITHRFITPQLGENVEFDFTSCVDKEGNTYPTVEIGNQLWMASNLKTSYFKNGDPIPQIQTNKAWKETKSSAVCQYDNVLENIDKFGLLYNGYAATDKRGVCPQGWRVPTDDDWTTLLNTINKDEYSGTESQLLVNEKEWQRGNNLFGFSAISAGMRYAHNGAFGHKNQNTRWWTSTISKSNFAWNRYINDDKSYLGRGEYNLNYGYSIRCIKE